MILFSGVGLGIIAIIIKFREGDNPFKPKPRDQVPVLHTFNICGIWMSSRAEKNSLMT